MTHKPIFPIRLGKDDKSTLQALVKKYGLQSKSDAVRAAVRVFADMELTEDNVKEILKRYEEANQDNPETLKIELAQE